MPVVDIARVITDATQSRWTPENEHRFMNSPAIPENIEDFLDALAQAEVPYLLVGGIALLQYVEGRNTQDIDFIIALDDALKIPGFEITDQNEFFAQGHFGELQVDLLRPSNLLFRHILETERTSKEFLGHILQTVTPRGLALLKLYALPSLYRQGNITRATLYEGDLTLLLNQHPSNRGELIEALKPHLIESDLNEVGKILDEISHKLSRFQ
jgi:hypothetical protein